MKTSLILKSEKVKVMYGKIQNTRKSINEIREAGLYKSERVIESPQEAHIKVAGDKSVLNMCANNYLGLSDHPAIVAAAHQALDDWGYGLSSVRFICGTQAIHKELEAKISEFLGMEDTILYTSCFDANGGLFETILSEEDAIIPTKSITRALLTAFGFAKRNVFAIKTAIERPRRKPKAARVRRERNDCADGRFFDGLLYAKLDEICELAEKYEALVMVDDSHAVGFVGKTGAESTNITA